MKVFERPKVTRVKGFTHCGESAILGDPVETERCIQRDILCATCGALLGIQSTRKDLADPGGIAGTREAP